MIYFIPAWYAENEWKEKEQRWYKRRMRTEFDDTVKQVQLFYRTGTYPCQMLLLNHAPNFRHFLHRQGIFHAPYWSCFDAIQEVEKKKTMTLSYRNLKWPEDTEFVYSQYAVIAMRNNKRFAKIEFAEDGNPIEIDMYKKGELYRSNYYDDRGFISRTCIYSNEKPVYEEYLRPDGVWKLRVFLTDGHVEINPECNTYLMGENQRSKHIPFARTYYENLGQVVCEVTENYIKQTNLSDVFCVAVHKLHFKMLCDLLKNRKLILSFFGKRYVFVREKEELTLVKNANYIITDSQDTSLELEKYVSKKIKNIKDLTPYDSRQDFGISQSLPVQKILVPIDGLDGATFRFVVEQLALYMEKNEFVRVHLFTRLGNAELYDMILNRVRQILVLNGYDPGLAEEPISIGESENRFYEFEDKQKIFLEQCVDELSVSKCIREQRIIVDLRTNPDVYLQISGISVGIPQIVGHKTQYVKHNRNGYFLSEKNRLNEVIAYYLESQKNWNNAMIEAYEIGKIYSTQQLIERWDEVIKAIG